MKYGKKRGEAAVIIDIKVDFLNETSYVILDPLSKGSQNLIEYGILCPIQVTKKEAIDIMGEEKVKVFENMINNISSGGPDYRLTRYQS